VQTGNSGVAATVAPTPLPFGSKILSGFTSPL